MDEMLKELAIDHRNDLMSTAIDGFDMSLEIVGNDVSINGVTKKVIFKNKEKLKYIAAKIGEIDIGDLVEYQNKNWLIVSLPMNNEVYLKAEMQLCNSLFPIKSNKTRVLIGYDGDQRPIYRDDFTITNEPVITSSTFLSVNDNTQLPLPEGRLDVIMRYIESDDIAINNTFDMYNNTYKIIDIDYTKVINNNGISKGVITIRSKRDVEK